MRLLMLKDDSGKTVFINPEHVTHLQCVHQTPESTHVNFVGGSYVTVGETMQKVAHELRMALRSST